MFRTMLLAALACIALPAAAAACAGFTDVEDTDPFCPNVAWIKNRNITLGCATGLYCPTTVVSRLAMAAFLNRLGDVVLPPNVIWVAPTGGQFQSIQAAIDAASVGASATQRRLIKVAPGEYAESVVMAPFVDVEGSGPDATTIVAEACVGGTPGRVATVALFGDSQLRGVTIKNPGSTGDDCAGAYLAPGQNDGSPSPSLTGTPLRNVVIDVVNPAPQPQGPRLVGIRIVGTTLFDVRFEDIRTRVGGGNPTYGMLFTDIDPASSPNTVLLREVEIVVSGTGGSYGISAQSTTVTLDRVDIRVADLKLPIVLEAKPSLSNMSVRDSFLGAIGGSIQTYGSSFITISNTEFLGLTPPWPGVSCYNVFSRASTIVSIAC